MIKIVFESIISKPGKIVIVVDGKSTECAETGKSIGIVAIENGLIHGVNKRSIFLVKINGDIARWISEAHEPTDEIGLGIEQ